MDLLPPRPGTYFCFFSAGFRICASQGQLRAYSGCAKNRSIRTWNEQSRLSSTLIMAPALSNSPQ